MNIRDFGMNVIRWHSTLLLIYLETGRMSILYQCVDAVVNWLKINQMRMNPRKREVAFRCSPGGVNMTLTMMRMG